MAAEKQILSFYIPYIPEDFGWWAPNPMEKDRAAYYAGALRHSTEFESCSKEQFVELFESNLNMGKIKRIDFMNRINPKTGKKITSAFVHFENIKDTPFTRGVFKYIKKYGKTMLYGVPKCKYLKEDIEEHPSNTWHEISDPHQFFITSSKQSRHLILCENLSPIP